MERMLKSENFSLFPHSLNVGNPVAAYFITYTCYGSHLHGVEPSSVDRNHNLPGSRYAPPDDNRLRSVQRQMVQQPYLLDFRRREAVLLAIQEVCSTRRWSLIAAHVRTNHVHVVVGAAEAAPESAMHDFKAYASRMQNQLDPTDAGTKRWTRHGSTRHLWSEQEVNGAVWYVLEGQGEPMAVFSGVCENRASAP